MTFFGRSDPLSMQARASRKKAQTQGRKRTARQRMNGEGEETVVQQPSKATVTPPSLRFLASEKVRE